MVTLTRRAFFGMSLVLLLVFSSIPLGLSFLGYSLSLAVIPLFGSASAIWGGTLLAWQLAVLSLVIGLVVGLALCAACRLCIRVTDPRQHLPPLDTYTLKITVPLGQPLLDKIAEIERYGQVQLLGFKKKQPPSPPRQQRESLHDPMPLNAPQTVLSGGRRNSLSDIDTPALLDLPYIFHKREKFLDSDRQHVDLEAVKGLYGDTVDPSDVKITYRMPNAVIIALNGEKHPCSIRSYHDLKSALLEYGVDDDTYDLYHFDIVDLNTNEVERVGVLRAVWHGDDETVFGFNRPMGLCLHHNIRIGMSGKPHSLYKIDTYGDLKKALFDNYRITPENYSLHSYVLSSKDGVNLSHGCQNNLEKMMDGKKDSERIILNRAVAKLTLE